MVWNPFLVLLQYLLDSATTETASDVEALKEMAARVVSSKFGCDYLEQALSIIVMGASGDLAKKKVKGNQINRGMGVGEFLNIVKIQPCGRRGRYGFVCCTKSGAIRTQPCRASKLHFS